MHLPLHRQPARIGEGDPEIFPLPRLEDLDLSGLRKLAGQQQTQQRSNARRLHEGDSRVDMNDEELGRLREYIDNITVRVRVCVGVRGCSGHGVSPHVTGTDSELSRNPHAGSRGGHGLLHRQL